MAEAQCKDNWRDINDRLDSPAVTALGIRLDPVTPLIHLKQKRHHSTLFCMTEY